MNIYTTNQLHKSLCISKVTLFEKIKKLGIEPIDKNINQFIFSKEQRDLIADLLYKEKTQGKEVLKPKIIEMPIYIEVLHSISNLYTEKKINEICKEYDTNTRANTINNHLSRLG